MANRNVVKGEITEHEGDICQIPVDCDEQYASLNSIDRIVIYVDGGAEPKNPGGCATSGYVIYEFDEQKLFDELKVLNEHGCVVREGGPLATNNYGEYMALRLALEFLHNSGFKGSHLTVKADSKLLVEQVSKNWKCNKPHLREVRDEIWALFEKLNLHVLTADEPVPAIGMGTAELVWVPRDSNQRANDLCRAAYQAHKSQ